ncbi:MULTISPECIES: HVO_0758 family zinc finger protein [Halosegnis]|jgi:methionyl-tRNA synthetase|uniref:HVO_0758 family zinc finger protein n=1 Tax=Halosegnis TaxID=2841540 RepID=UPI001561B420|nr:MULTISPECIES: HVO_0758 family zinc finger protein [Halobacteriales]
MDTVRQGLRAGDIEKDTYERLTCAHCGESLATRDTDDGVGKIRSCPDCDREYKEL